MKLLREQKIQVYNLQKFIYIHKREQLLAINKTQKIKEKHKRNFRNYKGRICLKSTKENSTKEKAIIYESKIIYTQKKIIKKTNELVV